MIRAMLVALLLPLAAHAQLALFTVDNSGVATPLGSFYDMGKVPAGDVKDLRIRLRNNGAAPLAITYYFTNPNPVGFSLQRPSLPFTLAPGFIQDTILEFSSTMLATFPVTVQINDTSFTVIATTTPAAVLTVQSPCSLTGTAVAFGNVQRGLSELCIFNLTNPSQQPLTVSTLSLSATGFQLQNAPEMPLTLAAGQVSSFTVTFAPTATQNYAATLAIDSRSYSLTGGGFNPTLPSPIFSFDSGPFLSSQQRTLSLSLPSPSPITTSGLLTLSFTPDSAIVSSDPTVIFATSGAKALSFSINQGDTQFKINGQSSVVFQTGTSSGRLGFTMTIGSAVVASHDETITPAAIALDTTIATRRPVELDIELVGYDNTYTTGSMAFTFYDSSGKAIGGKIPADFSSNFRSFYTVTQKGSMFHVVLAFGVSGDPNAVGSVDVDLANSFAKTTQHLIFH